MGLEATITDLGLRAEPGTPIDRDGTADAGTRHDRAAVMRHDLVMRAELKSLWLEPDPATLSGDPAAFALNARLMIGPADGPGEESFDVTICTPEWLSVAARGGFYDARHHVVVDFEAFDQAALHRWLARRVETVQADTWKQIGERLSRLGYWEFEDYRP